MARNKLAGTRVGKSKSAKNYHKNDESRRKKIKYDTEYNKSPKQKLKRAVLQAINRAKGTHGNHDMKDEAHVSKNKTVKQDQSKNRGDKKRIFFREKGKKKRG